MPADPSLSQEPSVHHGDASQPYPCCTQQHPPGAAWAINYGYCRHSLDALAGRTDPRCPAGCPHKAPADVADEFGRIYEASGAQLAAGYTRRARQEAEA